MLPNDTFHILVVEDERDLQAIFAELLPYFDLSADPAMNANEALRLLSKNHYAGAIIDIDLPGIDGWQLIEMIRSQPANKDLPCVAVTAWHGSGMKQRALAAGFNAYFSKPFEPESFVQELRRVIFHLAA
jgi:CheY-like chemotaxis protein